jgi:hypothetical protein
MERIESSSNRYLKWILRGETNLEGTAPLRSVQAGLADQVVE